jgi:RNA polymerase sigma factor (sigma-70 family)
MVENSLRDQILAALPSLRAFATSLTGNRDRADDLVQDAILRAWANIDRFERGTNLNAWLFTILRNQFHSEYRKRKREVEDADGSYAARLKTHPDQQSRLAFEDELWRKLGDDGMRRAAYRGGCRACQNLFERAIRHERDYQHCPLSSARHD